MAAEGRSASRAASSRKHGRFGKGSRWQTPCTWRLLNILAPQFSPTTPGWPTRQGSLSVPAPADDQLSNPLAPPLTRWFGALRETRHPGPYTLRGPNRPGEGVGRERVVHATRGAIARLEESDRRRRGTPTTRRATSTARSSQDLLLKPLLSVKEAALLLGGEPDLRLPVHSAGRRSDSRAPDQRSAPCAPPRPRIAGERADVDGRARMRGHPERAV